MAGQVWLLGVLGPMSQLQLMAGLMGSLHGHSSPATHTQGPEAGGSLSLLTGLGADGLKCVCGRSTHQKELRQTLEGVGLGACAC